MSGRLPSCPKLGHHIILPSGRRIAAKVTYHGHHTRVECAEGVKAYVLCGYAGEWGWPMGFRRMSTPPYHRGPKVQGLLCQQGHPFGDIVEVHLPRHRIWP